MFHGVSIIIEETIFFLEISWTLENSISTWMRTGGSLMTLRNPKMWATNNCLSQLENRKPRKMMSWDTSVQQDSRMILHGFLQALKWFREGAKSQWDSKVVPLAMNKLNHVEAKHKKKLNSEVSKTGTQKGQCSKHITSQCPSYSAKGWDFSLNWPFLSVKYCLKSCESSRIDRIHIYESYIVQS